MTGPSGEEPRAFWQVVEVDPPRHLVLQDKFAKPSSNSSRCGASIAVTVHQPCAFSPAGPVIQ